MHMNWVKSSSWYPIWSIEHIECNTVMAAVVEWIFYLQNVSELQRVEVHNYKAWGMVFFVYDTFEMSVLLKESTERILWITLFVYHAVLA